MNVAVTGMNCKADNPGPGSAVARCIRKEAEHRIVGLGYDVLDAGLYLSDAAYLLPYPTVGERAMLERLLEIHAREKLDAVIPCLDAELPVFLEIRDELARNGIKTYLPSKPALRARSKDRLNLLDVVTPQTRTLSDISYFRREADYPLVVKGIFYDAVVAHTPAQAEAAFASLAQQWGYPVLVQEFLRGDEYNLTAIGDGKSLIAPVMMRKRALTDKGKAWAGVTVVDEQLERMAARLVQQLGWKGPLEVEALKAEDGRFYLIEVNPRFPSWIYLSQGVGRNLPALLLKLMSGEPLPSQPALVPGTMFLRYADEMIVDLASFESMMMEGARQ